MKRIFKLTLYILAILFLGIIAAATYIHFQGIPKYEKEAFEYEHLSDSLSLAKGEKLVATLCAGCHMNPETGTLAGTLMLDAPKEFGTIYTPNITQDINVGIGSWSDADIVYLLRTGILKDGRYAPPYMAKLPKLADSDMNAIIAFLRSDHPLVRADATPDKESKPSFLTKVLTRFAFKPLPMPEGPIELPDQDNIVEFGKYLAFNYDCYSCHSADFKSNDFLNPEKSVGYFGGGNKPLDRQGNIIITSNLTPDDETGIGAWNKQDFLQAVKYGKSIDGRDLRYPMNKYDLLSDYEIGSIYSYLQTIPAISNKIVE